MSWSAIRYVFSLPSVAPNGERITSTEIAVLAAIANRINHETRTCFPSVETISLESKASVPVVNRTLSSLKTKGLLLIDARYRKDGGRTSSRYRLAGFTGSNVATPSITSINDDGNPIDGGIDFVDQDQESDSPPSITLRMDNREVLTAKLTDHITERVGDAATPPAPARTKTTASKSPQTAEDVALTAACNQVYDAITSDHVLTKGECIQLRSNLKPFVMRYGADDVIAWHRAACRAKDGNYVPISYASRGINGWIAAGRPEIEPNPFSRGGQNARRIAPSERVATREELRAAAAKHNDDDRWDIYLRDMPGRGVDAISA